MASPKVAYRNIKYPRLEFRTGELEAVLPFDADPEIIIDKHLAWVGDKQAFIDNCLKEAHRKKLIDRSILELKDLVKSLLCEAEKEYGVKINRTRFLTMKTKWASCSDKGNLTLNTLLRRLPEPIIKYVVFHEAAHLIERRHKERFWSIIRIRFTNHNELEKELFTYWFLVNKAFA